MTAKTQIDPKMMKPVLMVAPKIYIPTSIANTPMQKHIVEIVLNGLSLSWLARNRMGDVLAEYVARTIGNVS